MNRLKYLSVILAAAAVFSTHSGSCLPIVIAGQNYPDDLKMWEHITGAESAVEFSAPPKGLILPHHTITSRETAGIYRKLSAVIHPERIIILSPDHYETAVSGIVAGENVLFPTVFGNLTVDSEFVERMNKASISDIQDSPFKKEHGIYYHAPFIKKYFPDAQIVPVLFGWKNSLRDNAKFAEWINDNTDDKTLIIASVDFSHFQPKNVSDFHDEMSYKAISGFNLNKIYDLEIDSPSSVFVLLKLMELSGCKKSERLLHTNSSDFTKLNERESTSHQYFAFSAGKNEKVDLFTVLLPGNIDLHNDSLFVKTGWEWDRSYDCNNDLSVERYLKNLRGREDRFFTGSDLYVFDLRKYDMFEFFKIDENITGVIKFHADSGGTENCSDLISSARKTARNIIVLYDYSGTETDEKCREKFRKWIDAGADVIIGKGIEKRGEEVYSGKRIFYSLGNFISEKNGSGEIKGLVFINGIIEKVYTFNIKLNDKFPELDL
ncbi:MAG: AmmeMemoRadiSam system protein B [Spirochaetes bacterium]|nr:AmmeMemoRadiSam system protein B [Spirochaetota bacterium]